MQAVTITQITPPELELLIDGAIKKALSAHGSATSLKSEIQDQWFDLEGYRKYDPDQPAVATVYCNISKIPHYKKGKKLYFLKSEIDAWLKSGRKKTVSEIQAAADSYLHSRKSK